MKATDDLKQEHRLIEAVLSALDHVTQGLERGSPLSHDFGEKLLDFLQVFVDKCHHGKEEQHFFKLLESRGISREIGLLSELLHEHGQGRAHVRAIARSWLGATEGNLPASNTFGEHAHGYTKLLRVHIDKEDNKLFPLAEQTLTAADDTELMAQFERLEREVIGEGVHEKYHRWAHELAEHKH